MTDDPFDGIQPETPPGLDTVRDAMKNPEDPPELRDNVASLDAFRNRPRPTGKAAPSPKRASRFFSAATLEGKPVPPRQWLVDDLVPARNVTLLYGDGGVGKSLVALQLAAAVALGRPWLGRPTVSGHAIFMSAEDDADELHRRLQDITQAEGVTLADLDRLTIRSLAGEDALLAILDPRSGVLHPSDLYRELDAYFEAEQPTVAVLDTLADLFPGNEIIRAQARQFIGMILGDAVGRELRTAYAAAPAGIFQVAKQTTVRDFRAKSAIQFGGQPDLEKVNEGGAFNHGTFEESAESYSIATFGKIFAISRQALVNDNLGAFTSVPARLGASARAFEAAQLVAKLTANPAMSDGVAVFHADHKNLSAEAIINATSLATARIAMRRQTGLTSELVDVTPRFVVVPPELELAAERMLTEIQAATVAEVNPFSNLSLVVEPRLTNTAQWYVAADPATIDGLEYAYLEGAPGPQIESKAGFEVDGVQIKVRLDFGCCPPPPRPAGRDGSAS